MEYYPAFLSQNAQPDEVINDKKGDPDGAYYPKDQKKPSCWQEDLKIKCLNEKLASKYTPIDETVKIHLGSSVFTERVKLNATILIVLIPVAELTNHIVQL